MPINYFCRDGTCEVRLLKLRPSSYFGLNRVANQKVVTSGRRTRDWQTRLMESSSALSGGLFSYAPDTFCSNDATFVEARENENMVLVLHSTGSCKRYAGLLWANFILKGHENGAITGHNGHENGAITGQKKT